MTKEFLLLFLTWIQNHPYNLSDVSLQYLTLQYYLLAYYLTFYLLRMEFHHNGRLVHVYFSKTVKSNATDAYENEISDDELERIRNDESFWNMFLPQYLNDRNISLTIIF